MNIIPSNKKATFDQLSETLEPGCALAGVVDVVMDEVCVLRSRHDWCWLSSEGIPAETGWYVIERK